MVTASAPSSRGRGDGRLQRRRLTRCPVGIVTDCAHPAGSGEVDGPGDDDDLVEPGGQHVLEACSHTGRRRAADQQLVAGPGEPRATAGGEEGGDTGHRPQPNRRR